LNSLMITTMARVFVLVMLLRFLVADNFLSAKES